METTGELRGFSVEKTAERLGVSTSTVRRWLREGIMGYVQPPGRRKIIIPSSSIDNFLSKLKNPA